MDLRRAMREAILKMNKETKKLLKSLEDLFIKFDAIEIDYHIWRGDLDDWCKEVKMEAGTLLNKLGFAIERKEDE